MIEVLIVSAAFGVSVWYVWRYYARRPRNRSMGRDGNSNCTPGCSGCPPRD